MNYCKIFLKPKKEESLLRFHPWVFSGAIQSIEGNPEEGDLVEVYGTNQRFLAIGHYQIGSIAVRILSFKPITIDADFWVERIRVAYAIRRELGLAGVENNNTFRLIHGEGDNLPGLVIDMYAHTAVMQAHSVGMHYACLLYTSQCDIRDPYYFKHSIKDRSSGCRSLIGKKIDICSHHYAFYLLTT